MSRFSVAALLVLFPALSLQAQDSTANAKLDTMLIYQRALMEAQRQMYEEVRYDDPLANKTMGLELNVARILVSTADDYFTFPGTFSLFSVDRSAEIAFPFFYQSGTRSVDDVSLSGSNTKRDVTLTLLNLDATYRRFLGKHQDGFYFSGGIRFTHIAGMEGNDFLFFSSGTGKEITVDKAGVYFGIGYRYFTRSGFYWGTNIIYGRYFSSDERDVREVLLDDSKVIIDFELLKFGIAF